MFNLTTIYCLTGLFGAESYLNESGVESGQYKVDSDSRLVVNLTLVWC